MARVTGKKAQKVVDEIDDLELEELEEDEPVEERSTRKSKRSRRERKAREEKPARAERSGDGAVTFGAKDLADHLDIEPKALRGLLRKMAAEGEITRDFGEGERPRYNWPKGVKDPDVQKIIKRVKSGAIEEARAEQLERLKGRKERSAKAKRKG
jgi:hypothetical protein